MIEEVEDFGLLTNAILETSVKTYPRWPVKQNLNQNDHTTVDTLRRFPTLTSVKIDLER